MKRLQDILPDAGTHIAQSGHQVSQKAAEVVIPLVQRDPRYWQLALKAPFAEQRGLAETRWCRDERQPSSDPLVQPLGQASARYKVRLERWDVKLGRK